MNTKIDVKGTIAAVTTEVDLAEWQGKYPDDQGVLNAAVREINKALAAILTPPEEIDARIAALTQQKAAAATLKPSVKIADDVARMADAQATPDNV